MHCAEAAAVATALPELGRERSECRRALSTHSISCESADLTSTPPRLSVGTEVSVSAYLRETPPPHTLPADYTESTEARLP